MPKPFASFCISTFKRTDFLRSTLNSIRAQSFDDFEVIVSDNDIEQSAYKVVESLNDSRFKYFANESNLGMKKSFNASLERSCGEYIVMIADDDPVYPHMLKTLYDLQVEFPGYSFYLGGCDWFCTSKDLGKLYGFDVGTNSCLSNELDEGEKKVFTSTEFLKGIYTFSIFRHYLWSVGLVKRTTLVANEGVPEYGTPFLGDYAYMSVAASENGCVIINKALGCQTLHKENFGRKQNDQLITVAKNFPAYIEEKASHVQDWPAIKPLMIRFTALWLVTHLTFLKQYYRSINESENGFQMAVKEVFSLDFMRPFRLKYLIKSNFPALHNFLIKLKLKLKS